MMQCQLCRAVFLGGNVTEFSAHQARHTTKHNAKWVTLKGNKYDTQVGVYIFDGVYRKQMHWTISTLPLTELIRRMDRLETLAEAQVIEPRIVKKFDGGKIVSYSLV